MEKRAAVASAWEQRKWSETFQVLPNNTLSRADLNSAEGKLRNVHYGDILIKYRERIDASLTEFPYISDPDTASKYMNATLQEGDVVFADTAEDEAVGKCVELRELHGTPVVSGLHTIPCRPVEEFADGYLGYFLNSVSYHNQLVPLMQGIKVTSISKGAIADTCVCYPSYEEQVQIGAYFTQLDNLITLHQRKYDSLCSVKKSMLQKMFPRDGASEPEIRFAGFTDPWEQRKLGDVARRVTRKNEGHESDLPLTISAQNGLVDQRSFFNNQVPSKDMSGYYLLHKGEFAYNKSTSSDSPWGAIKRLTKYEKGCVSTLYICFELLGADPDWLVAYYETNRWHRGVQLIAAEGARNHGLLNIAPDDFFDTVLTMPGLLEEQCQIGAFFSRLDNLITLHQRELDLLRKVKQSMLQKMFV